ncbi:MAG: hypothetical protein ACRETR_05485 [Steroidobacteraceae bacterium]
MSHPTSEADIERLARGVTDRTLPKSDWTHAAHFAVTLWLLRHRGDVTFRDMPPLIRAYNESTGVANTDTSGYHETITLASLRVARAWLAARSDMPLHAALAELLASPHGRSDWLLTCRSRERLFSVAARREWVEPDLRAFTY